MNSSGIKRGLATTAVTALAVAGVPFIATSAHAASGDTLGFIKSDPIRDGNAAGGYIYLKSNSATLADGDIFIGQANYSGAKAINTDEESAPEITSTAFDVDVLEFSVRDADNNEENGTTKYADGTYHYQLKVAVTLGSASKATFGIFEDADGNDSVSANDPKVSLEVTPTGAPASVMISPDSQTTATGEMTEDYTATVKDGAGNTTQLVEGEAFEVTSAEGVEISDELLDAEDLAMGTATFTATSDEGGTYTLTVAGDGAEGSIAETVKDTAELVVLDRAMIDEDEFDIATGADTWTSTSDFGDDVEVRVDQSSVTFNFTATDEDEDGELVDAGKVILFTVDSETLKFNGKTEPQTYSVVLDDEGKGSLTVTPSGIVAGSMFTFAAEDSGIEETTVEFARVDAREVDADRDVYVTKIGGNTTVVVTVLDQFGDPISGGRQVSITRSGRTANAGDTERKAVGADGTATFVLADKGTTALPGESLDVNVFEDQFAAEGDLFEDVASITYTADGLGGDFVLSDPSSGSIVPLTDAMADAGNESKTVTIAGGTEGVPAEISVDNGALILGADGSLAKAKATKTITLGVGGTGSFEVVGTKTGTVTVTVNSGGREKTETLTVKQATGEALLATARNVELEGPTAANAGQVATYTATVTDAFGNPVAGVDDEDLTFAVSGPANAQNKETETDADGELEQTVILSDNANSSITVTVTGSGAQFGAKADKENAAGDDAKGLTASQKTDSVTSDVVNMAALEKAVEDAQEALDEATAELAVAQGNLDVATTELAVAQANVDSLTEKKQALRQKLNKAKAKGNKQKAKTTRKKLRNVKRNLRAAEDNLTVATAKVAAAQSIVTIRENKVADAQAELDQAQQNLEDAQNG